MQWISEVFEKSGTLAERAIKHEIDLQPNSVPPANSYYRMSPVELTEVKKHLDEYFSKGWIRPSMSLYGAPFFFLGKRMEP